MRFRHLAGPLACMALLVSGVAEARSNGSVNGLSGEFGSDCTVCHNSGTVPIVNITGPTSVAAGSTNTYTLLMRGGQAIAGGLDVSTPAGALAVADPMTQLNGGEITHTSPKNADVLGNVAWTFNWTAPLSAGDVTLFGCGNSVNLNGNQGGDNAASATLVVTVQGGPASTPGETSGDGLSPLTIDGFDKVTGDVSLSYEAGCDVTDNNIYYGPLDQVASYAYSGETCSIGAGGSFTTFNPGSGSFFFIVVGNDADVSEGSYGLDGLGAERPDFSANLCGTTQSLADRCDAP